MCLRSVLKGGFATGKSTKGKAYNYREAWVTLGREGHLGGRRGIVTKVRVKRKDYLLPSLKKGLKPGRAKSGKGRNFVWGKRKMQRFVIKEEGAGTGHRSADEGGKSGRARTGKKTTVWSILRSDPGSNQKGET